VKRLLLFVLLAIAPAPSRSQPINEATFTYSLPPDKLQRAIEYTHARNWLHFTGEIYAIAAPVAILLLGLSAKFRNWAEATSRRRFVQALIFVPLILLVNDLLYLPIELYSQHLERKFDQSIQSWPSWFWDWTKGELLATLVAILLLYILYAVIRRSPRRWWFYFWLAALPILFTGIFIEPFLIEPLFNKFEPLANKRAALVNQLEKVVARGNLAIPPDRMFEMNASKKVNSLNAYVTGIGASKRVVVWDTTLAKLTSDEVLSVFGHEMGHYVLGHVLNSLLLAIPFALLALYAGYRILLWLLARWGASWHIRAQDDWASIQVLVVIAALFGFFSEPVINTYSRWQEHQADIYGLEVIHGIVPNPSAVTAHTFQVLGEESLDEPNPNPFLVFWTFSHPSISERMAFSGSYDPWTKGRQKFIK
jgi:STE24 endopeptidase